MFYKKFLETKHLIYHLFMNAFAETDQQSNSSLDWSVSQSISVEPIIYVSTCIIKYKIKFRVQCGACMAAS